MTKKTTAKADAFARAAAKAISAATGAGEAAAPIVAGEDSQTGGDVGEATQADVSAGEASLAGDVAGDATGGGEDSQAGETVATLAPADIEALPEVLEDWTQDDMAKFTAWYDSLPDDTGAEHPTGYLIANPAVGRAFAIRRDALRPLNESGFALPLDLFTDRVEPTLHVGNLVMVRSNQAELTGRSKASDEVPALLTWLHDERNADLTVFRASGAPPIGLQNIPRDDRGGDAPGHVTWRPMWLALSDD